MTLDIIIGILIRHTLTAVGISTAIISGEVISQVAGLLATGVGLGLSALEKKKR